MSNRTLLQAPEAAFTGCEKNCRAQLFELLWEEFTFEMSDSMRCCSSYFGRDEFVRFREAVAKEWAYFCCDAHEMIDPGNTIVVPVKTDTLSIRGIRLQNEHLFPFKVKDGLPEFACLYADTGRDIISGHAPRRYPKSDLSDRTSLPTE